MSDQISWQVTLAVKPGELDSFRALTNEMVASTRDEPGVLIYERFVSGDGTLVYLYERYVDSSAAAAHLRTFRKQYGARFATMVDRKSFTVCGTPSDELRQILDDMGVLYASPCGGFSR